MGSANYGMPINPNYPSGSSQSMYPTNPALMKPYRNVMEAMDAYQNDLLHGGNLPLSSYLSNVQSPGTAPYYPQPLGSKSTASGESSTAGETSRELPPEIRQRYQDLVDRLLGQDQFGFTPEEQAAMQISPEGLAGITHGATAPIAGAANAARDRLMLQAAAKGNYAPGLNATLERIQQEQGRQSSEAALQARLGVEAANRQAALSAANARLGEKTTVSGQAGGLLQGYPEFTGKSSETSTSSSKSSTLPTSATGGVPAGSSGAPIGGGSTGVAPKPQPAPAPPPAPGAPPPTIFGKKKQQPAGGLLSVVA